MLQNRFLLYLFLLVQISQCQQEFNVTFRLNHIDSNLQDIQWCGGNGVTDIPIILTDKGSIYKSTDFGQNWVNLNNKLQQLGKSEIDKGEVIGQVSRMMISPSDKNIIIFLGTHGINWISKDCGNNIIAMNQGRKINEFQFHPIEKNWLLAAAWTLCDDFIDQPCQIYKELFISTDLGTNWRLIEDYVVQFQWACIDETFVLDGVPKERIVLAHEPNGKGHQSIKGWSNQVTLSFSDDFFKSSKEVVKYGNKFLISKNYFFVAQVRDEQEQDVQLMVSEPNLFTYDFVEAVLPVKRFKDHSYTVLDNTEGMIFLHVNHQGSQSKYGNIYVSDATGTRFSTSIQYNVRSQSGQCDFDKLLSQEGVYITNIYDKDKIQRLKDIDSSSLDQGSKRNADKTQQQFENLDNYKQSFISFDKGGIWKPIMPPLKDSLGKKIYCPDDLCSLHINLASSSRFGPVYSTKNAVGILIATGNVGYHLSSRSDEINTYLSRDSGLTWDEIAKGSHIYEIGDHGGLLLMAEDQKSTNEIKYSWDEGITWNIFQFTNQKIEITNIIMEPSNIGNHFIIYGEDSKGDGFVLGIDFSSLHQKQCQGADNPENQESDYEFWSPSDVLEGSKCLLGHKVTYVRRKRDSQCYNGVDFERPINYEDCLCTEENWDCDIGYSRNEDGPCLPINGKPINYKAPQQCRDYYYVSQGYRKVAGDTCKGGVSHEYLKIPCPGTSYLVINQTNGYLVFFIILLLCIIFLGGNQLFIQQVREMIGLDKQHLQYMGFDKHEDVDFSQMIFDKNEKLDESNDEDTVEKLLDFNPRAK